MRTELCDVAFSFGGKRVFTKLNLTVEGPVTVVEGPSGEGKTTLLRLLAGLLKPESGSITGAPVKPSVMFQENRLLPWFTARENVAAVTASPREADRWLELVELSEEAGTRPGELSGGQQRRVALARALAYPSDALLLDEPLKGLDEALIRRLIPKVKALERPIVVTSHSALETSLWGGTVLQLKRE